MPAQTAIVLRLFERQWSGERGSLIPLHILNISRDVLKRIRSAAANIQGRNTGKTSRGDFWIRVRRDALGLTFLLGN